MKVLLSNYRYFVSGGPERYLFNLHKQLEHRGHEIIPFSIDYAQNHSTPYSSYFVKPIGNRHQVYYDQHGKSPATYFKTLSRLFYSFEVEKSVHHLIEDTRPEIAYVFHYLRKMSPSLLVGIKKKGIPIIVRLSDYMMLCPQAHCLRANVPCTLCISKGLFPSLKYKCIKGSQIASLLNLLASWYHHQKKIFDLIDTFVCTNQFMYNMMLEAGYSEKRLSVISTFTDLAHFQPDPEGEKSDYFIFVGRITHLKGLHIVLEALGQVAKNKLQGTLLKIAGTGDAIYMSECKSIIASYGLEQYVEFLGEVGTEALPSLYNRALFSIVSSLAFENLPNSMLESYSCGTPVIASNIGSLTSCVREGKTGFLVEPGNAAELSDRIMYCLSNPALLANMSIYARQEAEKRYSPGQHIDSLLSLFDRVM